MTTLLVLIAMIAALVYLGAGVFTASVVWRSDMGGFKHAVRDPLTDAVFLTVCALAWWVIVAASIFFEHGADLWDGITTSEEPR